MQTRLLHDGDMRQAISLAVIDFYEETGKYPSYEDATFPFENMTVDDCILGAFDHSRLIGLIIARKEDNGSYDLCNLYVDPSYRRQGIGKQLFQGILNIVDSTSPQQPTTLKVQKSKPFLKRLYEDFGFNACKQGILPRIFKNLQPMERAPVFENTPSELTP